MTRWIGPEEALRRRPEAHHFLDAVQYAPEHSQALSDSMAEQAQLHQRAAFADTEHNTEEQWRFEPIKKWRGKGPSTDGKAQQGTLF